MAGLVGEELRKIAARIDDPTTRKFIDLQWRFPFGKHLSVAHDGFSGTVQGYYVTREGKPGLVLQQDGNRVVHVYSEKWFT